MLVTREDFPARRKTKTLDELLLEIEQLSQERASHVSVEPDDEETCLLLHEPGKAIIDTGCGRCVIGAKENGAVLNTSSEELVLTKKQISAPMTEGPSGHFELDLCPREEDFGEGRTGILRPSPTLYRSQELKNSPSTPLRALVTCWRVMTPGCSLFPQNVIL